MTGIVTPDLDATLLLTLEGPSGTEAVEAVVDTGFNGFLTVPPALASQLALPIQAPTRATLADGTEVELDVVEVTVLWDGQFRTVAALVGEGGVLIGMSLMYGYHLGMDIVGGGAVTLQRLP